MKTTLIFRFGTKADAPTIINLINSSYRGEISKQGWTTEADLVGGVRIDSTQIDQLIDQKGNHIILALNEDGTEILGCVHTVIENENTLYFGLFAVKPNLQGRGIGKALMNQVESHAKQLGLTRIRITVIHFRQELIDYYQRRGFRITGREEDFPNEAFTKVKGIKLIEMVKFS